MPRSSQVISKEKIECIRGTADKPLRSRMFGQESDDAGGECLCRGRVAEEPQFRFDQFQFHQREPTVVVLHHIDTAIHGQRVASGHGKLDQGDLFVGRTVRLNRSW